MSPNRVMRVLKLIRRSKKLMTIATVMKNCVSELFLLIVIWTMGVIVFAMLMYTFEEKNNNEIESGELQLQTYTSLPVS